MNPQFPANPDDHIHSGRPEDPDSEPASATGHHAAPVAEGNVPDVPPGYFPRLLSAAALVSHVASDGALERFGLTRSSFALLGHLETAPAGEGVLAERTGLAAGAVRRELLILESSGYVAEGDSWSITDTGRKAVKCAQLAEAEITLDAEDSQELRKALRSLIASLRLEHPDR